MQTFTADSRDLGNVYSAAQAAVEFVRSKRKPALLHLKTYRLFGHAGADAEVAYRKKEQIEGELEQDPLLYATALLLSRGVETAAQLAAQIEHLDQQIARVAQEATQRPKLKDAAAVIDGHGRQAIAVGNGGQDFPLPYDGIDVVYGAGYKALQHKE